MENASFIGRNSKDYTDKGKILLRQKKFAAAEADFTRVIELDTHNPDGYILRAAARSGQHKFPAAEEDYNQAIRLGGSGLKAYRFRAVVRFEQGNFAGAEEDLSQAIILGGLDAKGYILRGEARSGQKKFAAAEADFTRAIGLGMQSRDVERLREEAKLRNTQLTTPEQVYSAAVTPLLEPVVPVPANGLQNNIAGHVPQPTTVYIPQYIGDLNFMRNIYTIQFDSKDEAQRFADDVNKKQQLSASSGQPKAVAARFSVDLPLTSVETALTLLDQNNEEVRSFADRYRNDVARMNKPAMGESTPKAVAAASASATAAVPSPAAALYEVDETVAAIGVVVPNRSESDIRNALTTVKGDKNISISTISTTLSRLNVGSPLAKTLDVKGEIDRTRAQSQEKREGFSR